MINNVNSRQSNPSVIFDEELTIPAGEELVLDFDNYDNKRYAIGIPFKNIELQNLGDETGANANNLVVYFNQATKQSQKIRKNFVFEKSDQQIRSLKIRNVSQSQPATFDLRLDNKETELEIQQQIRNKLLNVKIDNSGIVRA